MSIGLFERRSGALNPTEKCSDLGSKKGRSHSSSLSGAKSCKIGQMSNPHIICYVLDTSLIPRNEHFGTIFLTRSCQNVRKTEPPTMFQKRAPTMQKSLQNSSQRHLQNVPKMFPEPPFWATGLPLSAKFDTVTWKTLFWELSGHPKEVQGGPKEVQGAHQSCKRLPK